MPNNLAIPAPTTCPLQAVNQQLRDAFEANDLPESMRLVERDLLEAWYGFPPDELRRILETLIDAGLDTAGLARGMHLFVGSNSIERFASPLDQNRIGPLNPKLKLLLEMARMLDHRLQGRPTAALTPASDINDQLTKLQSIYDPSGGWDLMGYVQTGITAMLAGDNQRALLEFATAKMQAFVPSLAFLTRDAYIKAAIVHATYGDPQDARNLLEQSMTIPRTISWAEPVIDASALIAKSLLLVDEPDQSKALIDQVPIHHIGEMWPFYLVALHRAYERLELRQPFELRVKAFEKMPLPRTPGDGFTGSVIPMLHGTIAMANGDFRLARHHVNDADPSLCGTQMMLGHLALVNGNPQEAIRIMNNDADRFKGLRQLEVWRLAIIAGAYLSLGEEAPALSTLKAALNLPGTLRPYETQYFSKDVRTFAAASLTEWPEYEGTSPLIEELGAQKLQISSREVELLKLLRSGSSRADMSAALFVSLNTVKTHLSTIFKKLGVRDRNSAVREAERRGII